MLDTENQLARLRERVAAIQARGPAPQPQSPRQLQCSIEELLPDGRLVQTSQGQHFEIEQFFPGHKPHGSADVGALSELPDDLLTILGTGSIPKCGPECWAFLDTETTGISGGTGTYAFLIGVGRIEHNGFRIRQFFLRESAEERSALLALAAYLSQFEVLVTYNGRTYDQPLLEVRYTLARQRTPFARLPHLDLLYGARHLWKLRLENCRLTHLEAQILGYEREGDVPGNLIPSLYVDYLRSGRAQALSGIFRHNALDLVTLACLTAIVPTAFQDSGDKLPVRHGSDLAGIARWVLAQNEPERALRLFQQAVDAGVPDSLLFRCLWDIALLEKKLGRPWAAVAGFTELANCRNAYRAAALEELAKFYEHKEKNFALALDFTCEALRYAQSSDLLTRKCRLELRLTSRRPRQTSMRI